MSPNITDPQSWQQANLLLQPIFIRLIDHLRKILEDSGWLGEYQNREIWPPSVEESVKVRRQTLLQTLETPDLSPEDVESLQAELAILPSPYPGYQLLIFPKDSPESSSLAQFDLWELCYRICFCNYVNTANAPGDHPPAIVDQTLLDEAGEVEWNAVDRKTAQVVAGLFQDLPR